MIEQGWILGWYLLAVSLEDGRVGALAELLQLDVGFRLAEGGVAL